MAIERSVRPNKLRVGVYIMEVRSCKIIFSVLISKTNEHVLHLETSTLEWDLLQTNPSIVNH